MKTQTEIATPKLRLRIANSRGRKPVIRDIKRARDILQGIKVELNSCEGAELIDKCTTYLWDVLCDNE